MLEWMHDVEIQKAFKRNMLGMTLAQVQDFCRKSVLPEQVREGDSLHFAIVDEAEDEYLGTISLKDMDLANGHAEYAISTRRKAWGQGIAKAASLMLLDKAFHTYGLNRVFLSVVADNLSAIHLYEACGFKLEGEFRNHFYHDGQFVNWRWYGILKSEFEQR